MNVHGVACCRVTHHKAAHCRVACVHVRANGLIDRKPLFQGPGGTCLGLTLKVVCPRAAHLCVRANGLIDRKPLLQGPERTCLGLTFN